MFEKRNKDLWCSDQVNPTILFSGLSLPKIIEIRLSLSLNYKLLRFTMFLIMFIPQTFLF